ncbi:hypothetical protein J7T55_015573 [Diaporthe amygdali]|uniref:uncharacterized protein n=1 Tax=Phomopsis amygdali TaxID=1214568 RepID=UPI0022FDDF55|nr:uncharacterized protein J7T55_015573 [Diaporthe amygdali]KAJ0120838.1 hypothetical protein J7T55_015573 [Diaporthe amygdali]
MSKDADLAQEQVHSYLWDTTQQGTCLPHKGNKGSRTKRVKKAIQAVDHQFSDPSSSQQQGQAGHGPGVSHQSSANKAEHQGTHHNADLNGVGYQFHGYTHD